MITLHHLEKSRSFRILWLLEELKAAYPTEQFNYQLIQYQRDKQSYLAPEQLLTLHPMGKAPILTDSTLGESNPLAESAVIIEYLLKKYDHKQYFYPKIETSNNSATTINQAWLDYTFWLHFAEGSLMPPLVMSLILSKTTEKSPWIIRPILAKVQKKIGALILNGNIRKGLDLIEKTLTARDYLCGQQFTGADIQLYFAVAAAKHRAGLTQQHYPHIFAWLTRCEKRPAFQQAITIGGEVF